MNLKKLNLTVLLVTILVLVPTIQIVYASSLSTFYLSGGIYPSASTYTVWVEGSTYYAKDAYGQIQFTSSNASQVIQNSFDAIADVGGEIYIKKGAYYLPTAIDIPHTRRTFSIVGEGVTMSFRDYGGNSATWLYYDDSNTQGAIRFGVISQQWLGEANLALRNLAISVESQSIATTAIQIRNANRLDFENLYLIQKENDNIGSTAIFVSNLGAGGNNKFFSNIMIEGAFQYGIHWRSDWGYFSNLQIGTVSEIAFLKDTGWIIIDGTRMSCKDSEIALALVWANKYLPAESETNLYIENLYAWQGGGMGNQFTPFVANGTKMVLRNIRTIPNFYKELNGGKIYYDHVYDAEWIYNSYDTPPNFLIHHGFFYDDYLGSEISTFWTQTVTDSGSIALLDSSNGIIRLSTGATSGSTAKIDSLKKTFSSNMNMTWESRFKVNSITSINLFFYILYEDANNAIWLAFDSGVDTKITLKSQSDGGAIQTKTLITFDTQWHTYRVEVRSDAITAYVDSIPYVVSTSNFYSINTEIPDGSGSTSLYIDNTSTSDKQLDIDYVSLTFERV